MASRRSSSRRRVAPKTLEFLEAGANCALLRAVSTWVQGRKGWNRMDKRTVLENLEEARELIEENEQGDE